jgi:hypothetical protein
MAPDLFNESSKSGTRVTLRLLHREAYLAQHTAVLLRRLWLDTPSAL